MRLPWRSRSQSKPSKPTQDDYAKLGKEVESVLIDDYVELLQKPRRQITFSFLKGLAGGLGSVIGATIMVAFLLLILQKLGALPWIGQFFQNLGHTIKK